MSAAQQERIRQELRRAAFAKAGAELFLERHSADTALVRLRIGHLSFGIGQPRNGTEAASVLRTFRDALTDLLMAAADVDGVTTGVNIAAATLDAMADNYAQQHAVQDRDTGVWEFKRSEQEQHHILLCELAENVRSIVHGSAS